MVALMVSLNSKADHGVKREVCKGVETAEVISD